MEFFRCLMIIRRNMNSVHLLHFETKNSRRCSELGFVISRERECAFSLDLRSFGSSILDKERSKVDLRGEGYAWTPILWSSDNSKR